MQKEEMKSTIDEILVRLAHSTHSPRGKNAATDQTYRSLLDRIPEEQRPLIGKKKHQQSAFFTRWSAAACFLLVVGIGLAIAGIWHYHHYAIPSGAESMPKSVQSSLNEEPRDLLYQVTPLADITTELSEIYHVSIQIANPELCNYGITATFSTNEPIDEILAILAEIGNFEVRETSDGFIIE